MSRPGRTRILAGRRLAAAAAVALTTTGCTGGPSPQAPGTTRPGGAATGSPAGTATTPAPGAPVSATTGGTPSSTTASAQTCTPLHLPDHVPPGATLVEASGWHVTQGPRLLVAIRLAPAGAALGVVQGRLCSPTPRATVVAVARRAVDRATWTGTGRARSLVVSPTWAARGWPGATDAIVTELAAQVPEITAPGMRDQLRCHVDLAPGKATWDLEPARPDVGYLATVASRCNPGATLDPDGR